ncbi:undecaprenyldiphospho-muramoylpentapeptide beta-N-acetylglucosaminyltransferase [Vibrio sp. SS-MA-C1-2]|uniref:undecaprenyldiphospho-muramoylpentapeptide beta-N-acetylglucosaminyltransferase n=1 Tax=Vibrio sp. SS-MA-C1-2 TaxID=2908646 RepID=UPI001F18F553|nr:undecaprenyldiphospho-muramoylpentapeptide beta-N-acetylglucosaminyltransferase [Vibrio sp. SS-MA-C1-2]UJF19609.1 undecaprenyldiphospho-muramoylpentapeptide beta-N-acetylglucosaminyltransferase [Vibrio sp. SS-MA-C1-2]
MSKKLLVMAGGTGGHVFPGLAVAEQLKQQGWEIRWLGTADRMEADLVPKHGIEIDFIKVSGLRGQRIAGLITAPFRIFKAILQAKRYIKAWQPDVVLGMGGYVSGPGGVAAWLSGIPVVLHEQNAVAGLTNQWLAKIAKRVLQAFPGAFKTAEVVGNPVREDVVELPTPSKKSQDRPLQILVMGGSQGARILNQTVPLAANKLGDNALFWHQTGKGNSQQTKALYQNADKHRVDDFIYNVAEAYHWADLIICRSGALTVSEVSAAGLGAIFIPFMHKDRQQAKNAAHLVESGAAIIIEQPELTVDGLVETIKNIDDETLFQMATSARKSAITDAASRVATVISSLTKKN